MVLMKNCGHTKLFEKLLESEAKQIAITMQKLPYYILKKPIYNCRCY